ncbi:hypothetical protein GUJ93_ZPchr0015g6635 [Zizania palustris]|uniref:Uncharacterized protein n=1 Tax=Zizania palustris TaxID=103762 RepID=A0A8J5W0Z3_ZIZPA|nr:hypothetical protein GUJ93_ZPchr0015g6635 [Zizania palustris]
MLPSCHLDLRRRSWICAERSSFHHTDIALPLTRGQSGALWQEMRRERVARRDEQKTGRGGVDVIKKLIDMEALSLSRLKLVVLDIQRDAKSFTLFTLPQVSNEFWDLYKGYLIEKVRGGDTRICFYGAMSEKDVKKVLPSVE